MMKQKKNFDFLPALSAAGSFAVPGFSFIIIIIIIIIIITPSGTA